MIGFCLPPAACIVRLCTYIELFTLAQVIMNISQAIEIARSKYPDRITDPDFAGGESVFSRPEDDPYLSGCYLSIEPTYTEAIRFIFFRAEPGLIYEAYLQHGISFYVDTPQQAEAIMKTAI